MGNDKKIGGIFRPLSAGSANEKIREKQKVLGRKLTKEEKEDIRQDCARELRNKFIAVGVAVSTFITGFGAGVVTERLNAGDEPDDGVEVTTKADKDNGDDWTTTLKVDTSTPEQKPEQEPEVDEVLEQVKKEIAGLGSKEDVLYYFKQLYAQEYKEVMGKTISASSIKIYQTQQSYVYQLEDGTGVTHGDYPSLTKKKIEADGIGYKETGERIVYIVKDSFGNELDGMSTNGKKVIPGNSYDNPKYFPSALEKIGSGIMYYIMKLADLYDQLAKDPGNGYIEMKIKEAEDGLAKATADYKNRELEEATQQQPTQDNVENNPITNPTVEDDGR